MSRLPKWWTDTITLYNRYEDKQTNVIVWNRTVIPNCFFNNANNKITVGQTVIESNSIVVRIPQNDKYVSYGEWLLLGNDVRPNYFTLHQGDIIIKGDIPEVIDEYVKGLDSNSVLSKYKELGECLVITNFNDDSGTGRGLKHYRIAGE